MKVNYDYEISRDGESMSSIAIIAFADLIIASIDSTLTWFYFLTYIIQRGLHYELYFIFIYFRLKQHIISSLLLYLSCLLWV